MRKAIFLSLFASLACLIALFVFSLPAQADTCGNGQYGTIICPPTDVYIDKKVKNPITGEWVENLLSGDASFSPGSEVIYLLRIVNSSNQSFDLVKVEDILPEKLASLSIVDSDLNKVKNVKFEDNRVKFELANRFEGNTTVEVQLKGKIKDAGSFNSTKSLFCGNLNGLQNTAEVRANDRYDQDSTEICVQTQVLGSSTLPKAGVTDLLPLIPFIGTGLTGIGLLFKKRS